MSKVTSVEPQKRNPKRFNIFLDGEFAFGADEDLVVSYRLISGKIISENDLNHLMFEAEVGKLMERMYGLLSLRQRSEKEIRDYLKNLSFKRKIKDKEEISEPAIELLINRLKQKGLINDLEFAKAWIEGRRRSKNLGMRALKMELFKKGIEKEVIDELLVHGSSFMDQEEKLARQALEKKIKSWENLEPQEFKKKAMEFLMRKGFDWELIKKIVENILKKE